MNVRLGWIACASVALFGACGSGSSGGTSGTDSGSGSSFMPTAVFDGCDASQTPNATCQLFGGTQPAGYTPIPTTGDCAGDPSHQAVVCPGAHLLGICVEDGPETTYIYYYDTNQGNGTAKAGCQAIGATWHDA